ncbi:hypothetical protein HY029_01150 [Candidatus Gottesmanbacteria bacterium]|nr:hypothetical protein [Candidatus Gottesmanbacteria bacterium]
MKRVIFIVITGMFFVFGVPPVLAADPIGFFDSADCNQMTGWSGDPNFPDNSNVVSILDGGPAGSGKQIVFITADQPREAAVCQSIGGTNCSVCDSDRSQPQCKHGFVFQTPDSLKDGQTHQIYVHGAHYDWQGNNPLLQLVPRAITCSLGDATISDNYNGSPITLKTASKWAGAIDSITWKGKEFVYSEENGQEIGIALTMNDWGECYNPTETGSAKDYKGPTSSSKVLSFNAQNNTIETVNQMAFWFDPVVNAGFHQTCSFDKNYASGYVWAGGYPYNTSVLSDFILRKKISLGYNEFPNIIELKLTVTIPQDLKLNMDNFNKSTHPNGILDTSMRYMILQSPAGYIKKDFYIRHWYDPRNPPTRDYLSTNLWPDGAAFPAILSTSDEQYAVGVYTKEVPINGYSANDNEQYPYLGYTSYDWGPAMGIGAREPVNIHGPGDYYSTSYMIAGTLADVQESMHKLYLSFYPPSPTPTPTPTPIPTNSPTSVAVSPTSNPSPTSSSSIPGDLNHDGKVDINDYNQLITDFGKTGSPGFSPSDINKDGIVNIFDYNFLVRNYGK